MALAAAGVRRVDNRLAELSQLTSKVSFGTYKVLLVANEQYGDLTILRLPMKMRYSLDQY